MTKRPTTGSRPHRCDAMESAMKCYNGAWDSGARALFAEEDALMRHIRESEPQAHCTYFPAGGFFQVHVWGRLIGEQRGSRLAALESAAMLLAMYGQKDAANGPLKVLVDAEWLRRKTEEDPDIDCEA